MERKTSVNFQPVYRANISEPMIRDRRQIKSATRKPVPSRIFSRSSTRRLDNSPKLKTYYKTNIFPNYKPAFRQSNQPISCFKILSKSAYRIRRSCRSHAVI